MKKKSAEVMDAAVNAFMNEVYEGFGALALSFFDEHATLTSATELIRSLRNENKKYRKFMTELRQIIHTDDYDESLMEDVRQAFYRFESGNESQPAGRQGGEEECPRCSKSTPATNASMQSCAASECSAPKTVAKKFPIVAASQTGASSKTQTNGAEPACDGCPGVDTKDTESAST